MSVGPKTETETQAIVVEYDLPHAPAKVWRALTEPALLAVWLMQNDMVAEVGRHFTFKAPPIGEWDGVVQCQVLEVEAPKRLVYSWRGGSGNSRLDTVVHWTLEASATGTRLKLEHAGFLPMNRMAFEAMSKGWGGKVAARISEVLQQAA
jgi:uncharacterized protein YndB with AHSA1/START domain